MSISVAILIASTMNAPNTTPIFTVSRKIYEESPSGKTYTRTLRLTYCDLDLDGRAHAIIKGSDDLVLYKTFVRYEIDEDLVPSGLLLGSRILHQGPEGNVYTATKVGDGDTRTSWLNAWKQVGRPALKKYQRLQAQEDRDKAEAERKSAREKRDAGRKRS